MGWDGVAGPNSSVLPDEFPPNRPSAWVNDGVEGSDGVDPIEGSPTVGELNIEGPITRAGIAALCGRARELLERGDVELVVCDLGALSPDAVTIDALARLQLTTDRMGRRIRFRNACREVQELSTFCGLDDVLRMGASSPIEPRGEPEQGEQGRGVEEERDP
jgi:hypothetical protein